MQHKDFMPIVSASFAPMIAIQNLRIQARFEKGTRYYSLMLQQDLLNDWVIVADNGRIGSKLGQRRTIAQMNHTEAFENFCAMPSIRHKRGYCCISYSSSNHSFDYLLYKLATNQSQVENRPTPIKKRRNVTTQTQAKDIVPPMMQQYSLSF